MRMWLVRWAFTAEYPCPARTAKRELCGHDFRILRKLGGHVFGIMSFAVALYSRVGNL